MKNIPKIGKHSNGIRENKNKMRVIKNTQSIMSNHTISLIFANKAECNQLYYKDNPAKISPQLAWHFDNTRCYWNILCGVICRNQQKEHYIQYVYFGSTKEILLKDLSDYTYKVCEKIFNKAIKMHKLCPFYMARPQNDINPLLILDTIHKHKVLNLIGTNFELDCNIPFTDYHTSDNWINVLNTIKFEQLNLNNVLGDDNATLCNI